MLDKEENHKKGIQPFALFFYFLKGVKNMEAHHYNTAVPCRCGGQAKIFGPSGYAPTSHWGIYCSKENCEKMAVSDSLEESVERWNEEQALEACLL